MGDALHTPGVVSAAEARLDDAGLIAVQGPTALDVRTGVLHGPGTTTLVTGTSATAPMQYAIAPHHWVTSRQATDGVYRGALEAVRLVSTTAAPASGSRIDVIYEKQGDPQSTITPGHATDAAAAPVYGVLQGVATTGTPQKPDLSTIPGAIELATATVSAGATATNGAGVTIANTARLTVARGAPIPVRSQAERDALATAWGASGALTVKRLDVTGRPMEEWDGTTWRRYLLADDSDWVDIVTRAGFTANGTPRVRRKNGALYFTDGWTNAGMAASSVYTVGDIPGSIPVPRFWYGSPGMSNGAVTARLTVQSDNTVQIVTGPSLSGYYRLDPVVIVL